MENYFELCPKFIENPHINPINNLPIADEEFDYYRDICRSVGFEFPPERTFQLMYNNKYYGKKICKDFLDDDTINPITGEKILKATEDYNNLIELCDYYGFDTSVLGEIKSVKSKSKRKNYLGQLPPDFTKEIKTSPVSHVESNKPPKGELLPIPKKALLSIPKKALLPIPKKSLLPVTEKSLLPIPKDISLDIKENDESKDDLLLNLKMIAKEIPKNKNVKKVVLDSLNIILQKNANYDGKKYTLSGSKNKYGIKQFIFDLLIDDELDIVMKILDFFGVKYIDIFRYILDFPKYAMNETLIINYFINAPVDTDWLEIGDLLEDLYSNWIIEDKLKMMTILLSSSIAVGNDFLSEILIDEWANWKNGIQDEIDETEEDIEMKDKLIDMVEILDTLSIR